MIIERIEIADRDTWLDMRRQNVNASEVAICCGEGAYGSLAELYAEKKGLRGPLQDSGVLRRGRWGEASVFEALREERPEWDCRRAAIYLCDRQKRIGATPDGFALAPNRPGRGVIQAKVIGMTAFRKRWLEDPSGSIDGEATPPIYYVLQVLTEMMLSESAWGVLVVHIVSEFDSRLRIFDIPRDPVTEAVILERVREFWESYFDQNIMPMFDPQRDERLIKALYPKDDGSIIDLSADNRVLALVDELDETKKAIKRMTEQCNALQTELTGKLQHHTYGQLADGRCLSWRTHNRKAYSVAASTYRVLKVLKQTPDLSDDDDE